MNKEPRKEIDSCQCVDGSGGRKTWVFLANVFASYSYLAFHSRHDFVAYVLFLFCSLSHIVSLILSILFLFFLFFLVAFSNILTPKVPRITSCWTFLLRSPPPPLVQVSGISLPRLLLPSILSLYSAGVFVIYVVFVICELSA